MPHVNQYDYRGSRKPSAVSSGQVIRDIFRQVGHCSEHFSIFRCSTPCRRRLVSSATCGPTDSTPPSNCCPTSPPGSSWLPSRPDSTPSHCDEGPFGRVHPARIRNNFHSDIRFCINSAKFKRSPDRHILTGVLHVFQSTVLWTGSKYKWNNRFFNIILHFFA